MQLVQVCEVTFGFSVLTAEGHDVQNRGQNCGELPGTEQDRRAGLGLHSEERE